MIKKNKYLGFLLKSPAIERHFPPDLTVPVDLWDEARLGEYHRDVLSEVLEHAYRNAPFYREKFDRAGVGPADFRAPRDLAKFPFTFKDELRGKPYALLAVPKEQICQVHLSTGTTSKSIGDHIYTLYSWDDIYVNELAIEVPVMVPWRIGDLVANALPYEMSSAGMAFHRSFQHVCGAGVINVGKGGFYSDPLKTILAVRDLGARVLLTTPSYALQLAEVAMEHGFDVHRDLRPKLLWLTGEGCSHSYRRRLEELWGCPALAYYGSLECGPIGVECTFQDGYHLAEGHVYVEIVDPDTGRALPPGSVGEVCVTVLYRRAAPLVRYRVGDLGYLETAPCPCCVERQRLVMRGRQGDQIRLGDRSYSPYHVEEMLYRIPEVGNNYRFLVDRDGLTVEVELRPGSGNPAKVAEKIRSRLDCHFGAVKAVLPKDHIERSRGKTTRVFHRYEDGDHT